MNPITQELVQSALQHRLDEALRASSGNLTAEVAEDARKAFLEAADARDGVAAMATALVASRIYERLGDRQKQLLNLIDFLQVQFMAADTVERYDTVRKGALSILQQADQAALPQLGFHAAVIAADSAFFAAESANEKWDWLITALRDVVAAFERAADFRAELYFVRLVDLAATVVNKVTPRVLLDDQEEERRGLLRQLAAHVDRLVPVNFQYPGNPQQSAKIAAILTQLTDDYGAQS